MKQRQEQALLEAFRKASEAEKKMIVAVTKKCANRQVINELKSQLGSDGGKHLCLAAT